MNFWSRFPFLRITIFFAAGIVIGEFFSSPDLSWRAGVAGVLAFLAIMANLFFRKGLIAGPLLLLTLVCFGWLRFGISDIRLEKNTATLIKHSEASVVVVEEKEALKGSNYRSQARIIRVQRNGLWQETDEKVLLYRKVTADSTALAPGSVLMVGAAPHRVEGPSHTAYFDYAGYLRRHQTRHRFFLSDQDYLVSGSRITSTHTELASLRADMVERLTSGITSGKASGVLAALVLGHREALDTEVREAYASAGAMHVLAVSGLHVGILYGVLMVALSFLTRLKHGRYIRLIIMVILMTCYAFLTGLSPSVTRAVIMFILVAVGQTFSKRAYIYNSLAVAAFISLIIDPQWLFAAGFQLSYLAVAGIVYLHPKIYRLWEPGSVITDKVWSLSAVTLAAQAATLPLTWLYFGQFPVYFLVSNLIVIPLATVVLISGIALLVLSLVPWLHQVLSFVCEMTVGWLNDTVGFFEAMPISQVRMPYVAPWQTILLFMVAFALMRLFTTRRYGYMRFAGVAAIMFFLSLSYKAYRQSQNDKLVWYAGKSGAYVEAIRGFHAIPVTGTMDRAGYSYQVDPMHRYLGIDRTADSTILQEDAAISWEWKGRSYLMIKGDIRKVKDAEALEKADVLATDRLYTRDWNTLVSRYGMTEVIITGYVSDKVKGELRNKAVADRVAIRFLRDKGLLMQ